MKHTISKTLSWQDRIKAALLLVVIVLPLIYLFEAFDLGWLFRSESSAKSNSWMGEVDLFLVSLFTLLPLLVLIEEFLFRYLPYKLSSLSKHKYFWLIGSVSAVTFAWGIV